MGQLHNYCRLLMGQSVIGVIKQFKDLVFSTPHASTSEVKANISRSDPLLTHGDYAKMFEENKKVMEDNFHCEIGKIKVRFDNIEGKKVVLLLLYLMMS
jgi:hypothetical protein